MATNRAPVIGFVAPSGSGKTTLLSKVVPLLRERGLSLGYLKHAHHGFSLDRPGKDSYEIAAAGARQVMLVSGDAWALITRTNARAEERAGGFDALCERFDAAGIDLVLVEGFRGADYPKIEVFRQATGKEPLYPHDRGIIAVATDGPLPGEDPPPRLPLDDPGAVADFIVARLNASRIAGADMADALIDHLHRLRAAGYNDAETGNASVRRDDRFWITPSGGGCAELTRGDLIACELDAPIPTGASLDAPVHLEVYRQQPDATAIVHSHGPHSVAISFAGRDFEPQDFEGARLLGSVPVLQVDPSEHREQAPAKVAEALASYPVCIVAGHGVYARGATLSDAYRWTVTLELSARIYVIAREATAI